MRVILLGHRGFVGSAIADLLRDRAELIGVDRENYASLRGTKGDLFINANGDSEKRFAEQDPVGSFRANVGSTLASIFDFPCDRYALISTINVYEDTSDPAHNSEDARIEPMRLPTYGYFKCLAEQLVQRHVPKWTIYRLGGMVGPGLRKNAIHDLLVRKTLFVHPDSYLCYIDTRSVARVVWELRECTKEIFNVCGKGAVRLADVASWAGTPLSSELYSLPRERYLVNVTKLSSRMAVPETAETVRRFVEEQRSRTDRTQA